MREPTPPIPDIHSSFEVFQRDQLVGRLNAVARKVPLCRGMIAELSAGVAQFGDKARSSANDRVDHAIGEYPVQNRAYATRDTGLDSRLNLLTSEDKPIPDREVPFLEAAIRKISDRHDIPEDDRPALANELRRSYATARTDIILDAREEARAVDSTPAYAIYPDEKEEFADEKETEALGLLTELDWYLEQIEIAAGRKTVSKLGESAISLLNPHRRSPYRKGKFVSGDAKLEDVKRAVEEMKKGLKELERQMLAPGQRDDIYERFPYLKADDGFSAYTPTHEGLKRVYERMDERIIEKLEPVAGAFKARLEEEAKTAEEAARTAREAEAKAEEEAAAPEPAAEEEAKEPEPPVEPEEPPAAKKKPTKSGDSKRPPKLSADDIVNLFKNFNFLFGNSGDGGQGGGSKRPGMKRTAENRKTKKAFIKILKDTHPDINADDKGAEERYKVVAGAYDQYSRAETSRERDEIVRRLKDEHGVDIKKG